MFPFVRHNPVSELKPEKTRQVKTTDVAPTHRAPVGAVLLACGGGALPEMATDVLDLAANYAVQNVKRDRSQRRPMPAWGQWFERVLSSRAARL